MTFIFRWNGRYFGFLDAGYLFAADGTYIGWADDDGRVWRADGRFIGELVDGEYVLRSTTATMPADRTPVPPPATPTLPEQPTGRPPRTPRPGYGDALDPF